MKELPLLDIPVPFNVDTEINENILNLYRNYPCNLKALVFVLCMGGVLEGTVNLNKFSIKKNDFVVLSSGSILQLAGARDNPKLYVMVFSSKFIESINWPNQILDFMYYLKTNPVISLADNDAKALEAISGVMINSLKEDVEFSTDVVKHMMMAILCHLRESSGFLTKMVEIQGNDRAEIICKKFTNLAIQYYSKERNISFYADKLGITPTYLSIVVKQVTGKTVMSVISSLVINDAKAKLKSTNLSVNEISDSLSFANASFFGKYFKRYVGMGPLAYRNDSGNV